MITDWGGTWRVGYFVQIRLGARSLGAGEGGGEVKRFSAALSLNLTCCCSKFYCASAVDGIRKSSAIELNQCNERNLFVWNAFIFHTVFVGVVVELWLVMNSYGLLLCILTYLLFMLVYSKEWAFGTHVCLCTRLMYLECSVIDNGVWTLVLSLQVVKPGRGRGAIRL